MESQNSSMSVVSTLGYESVPEVQQIDWDSGKQIVLILAVVAFLILGMIGAASTTWWISKNIREKREEFKHLPDDFYNV